MNKVGKLTSILDSLIHGGYNCFLFYRRSEGISYRIKKPPSLYRTRAIAHAYKPPKHTNICHPCNGGTPSAPTKFPCIPRRTPFRQPQLGSDIQAYPTSTGLAPSPARCTVLVWLTVFVNTFSCGYIIDKTSGIVKSFLSFPLLLSFSIKKQLHQN